MLTWGGGRGEVASEAKEDGGIRGATAVAEQVGGGGVGRAAIECRHQARHCPAPPPLRPCVRIYGRFRVGRWVCGCGAPASRSRVARGVSPANFFYFNFFNLIF